jgi:hypothetical protein
MRSTFAVTTSLLVLLGLVLLGLVLLGIGVADAADPTQLAETGGFLLGKYLNQDQVNVCMITSNLPCNSRLGKGTRSFWRVLSR